MISVRQTGIWQGGTCMEKYIYIFVIIFVVMIPIALYLILKPIFKHNKLLNGIVNYDTFMRKYVFSVALDISIICYHIPCASIFIMF